MHRIFKVNSHDLDQAFFCKPCAIFRQASALSNVCYSCYESPRADISPLVVVGCTLTRSRRCLQVTEPQSKIMEVGQGAKLGS